MKIYVISFILMCTTTSFAQELFISCKTPYGTKSVETIIIQKNQDDVYSVKFDNEDVLDLNCVGSSDSSDRIVSCTSNESAVAVVVYNTNGIFSEDGFYIEDSKSDKIGLACYNNL